MPPSWNDNDTAIEDLETLVTWPWKKRIESINVLDGICKDKNISSHKFKQACEKMNNYMLTEHKRNDAMPPLSTLIRFMLGTKTPADNHISELDNLPNCDLCNASGLAWIQRFNTKHNYWGTHTVLCECKRGNVGALSNRSDLMTLAEAKKLFVSEPELFRAHVDFV